MNSNEILILTVSKRSATYSPDAIRLGFNMHTIFTNTSIATKLGSRIELKLGRSWLSFLFDNSWKKKLPQIKKLIIVATPQSVAVVRYINKKFPEISVFVWYNNPVSMEVPLKYFLNLNCSIYTFDEDDSKKYNLIFSKQYIDLEPIKDVLNVNQDIKNDVVFIGGDKGRVVELLEVKESFLKRNISLKLYVVSTDNDMEGFPYQPKVSYKYLLKMQNESRAILEILQDGQSGISLRTLEAMFMKKKLITNNKNIEQADFYYKKNIFILGVDDLEGLEEFMNTPFQEVLKEIMDQYTFEGWVQRFI
ncbi:hypothetical protein [Enterococcus timonensis]|uniref:hypothetical protein n=1 Tax=Enterococcus timonensis TaxID=1852364 RepID=UPI0008D995A1|nr:hypothetical protein [Enterococcus timonensis]